jgi:hypothetical protein
MFKIWARVIKAEKIKKQYMYEVSSDFEADKFNEYLMHICKELDIETPMALNSHIDNFEEFNSVKFLSSNFIDTIDFDYLVLEFVK